jgi:ElaB/YqjD/DUF883 family membrane-anchored ribosome-binding protein
MAKAKKMEEQGMIRARLSQFNEKVQDVHASTQDLISDNPTKAALIAFGVGLLAGAVLLKLLEKD